MGDGGVHVKAHLVRHVVTSLSALKRFFMEDALKAFSLASVFWISVLWMYSMSQLSFSSLDVDTVRSHTSRRRVSQRQRRLSTDARRLAAALANLNWRARGRVFNSARVNPCIKCYGPGFRMCRRVDVTFLHSVTGPVSPF